MSLMFCSIVIVRCYLRLRVVYAAIDIVLVVIVHFHPDRTNRSGSKSFEDLGTCRFTCENRHTTAGSFRLIDLILEGIWSLRHTKHHSLLSQNLNLKCELKFVDPTAN